MKTKDNLQAVYAHGWVATSAPTTSQNLSELSKSSEDLQKKPTITNDGSIFKA